MRKVEVREHDDEINLLLVAQARNVHRQLVPAKGEAHAFAEGGRHPFVDYGRGNADDRDPKAAPLDDARWWEDEAGRCPSRSS